MFISNAIQNEDIVQYGYKYKHLTLEEICDIYKNDEKIEGRLHSFNLFKNKYPDLRQLEKLLTLEFLEKCKKDELLHWYIIKLVQYRRISLDICILMKLRLRREDVFSYSSGLVDTSFLSDFEEFAISKLKYPISRIQKSITIDLIRLILYFQEPLNELINKTKGNLYELKDRISVHRYNNIQCALNILFHMGYEIYNKPFMREELTASKAKIKNQNPYIIQSMKMYFDHNYEKTVISHLRAFFNFLWDYYPQIDMLQKINNKHIEAFVEHQKNLINIRGKKNSNATINHRLEAVDKLLTYFRTEHHYKIPNVVTKYDKLKEPKLYTKYESKEDIFKLIQAIVDADYGELYIQHKMVLLILIDTGRRIHEVLCLKYDCYKDGQVYFHKRKKNSAGWQLVGEMTINAIRVLKEVYANSINAELYSSSDKLYARRLIPSMHYKGQTILSKDSVAEFFEKVQKDNNITDENGKAKYTLHDSKRNFVTNMLGAGVAPHEIASYLRQNINSLVPYEVNNTFAIEVLKKVEEKGLLIGKGILNKQSMLDNMEVIEMLKDVNVVTRHKLNMINEINRPKEVMPLSVGNCTDYYSFNECGDLLCIACDEFKADSIDEFKEYAKKMYSYTFEYRRDVVIKELEAKLLESLAKAYSRIECPDKESFEAIIKIIKKSVKEICKNEKGN